MLFLPGICSPVVLWSAADVGGRGRRMKVVLVHPLGPHIV